MAMTPKISDARKRKRHAIPDLVRTPHLPPSLPSPEVYPRGVIRSDVR